MSDVFQDAVIAIRQATRWLLAAAIAIPPPQSLDAQQAANAGGRASWTTITTLGGIDEDSLRRAQLRGAAPTAGWLMRTPMSIDAAALPPARALSRCPLSWSPVIQQLDVTWNSDIPTEANDGAAWNGRGLTLHAMGGIQARCGPFRARLIPELWYARNRDFALVGVTVPGRSGFTSPFFSGEGWSADLPIRFGSEPLLVFDAGQSVVELDAGPVTVGVGTESEWWGPALRNALLLSNHAAGVPRFFVRTARPVRAPRVGAFEARWMVGTLVESPYFDFDENNDLRSLSGLAVTFTPAADTGLTIGAARVVYAPIPSVGALPARFFDAVARWGEEGSVRRAEEGRAADQLTSLFARWVFPASGVEAYGEWARVLLPVSISSLLTAPQHSQGYTLGMQWVSAPLRRGETWRVQAEATNLEQPLEQRDINPPTFYVSPTVVQGYTHRGQAIGAMIGPGSSAQWLAVDWIRNRDRAGIYFNRVRWANDAFFRSPTGFSVWAHDVSLVLGARGARAVGQFEVSADLAYEHRLNYLFQSATVGFIDDDTFDVGNLSLRLMLSPLARPFRPAPPTSPTLPAGTR